MKRYLVALAVMCCMHSLAFSQAKSSFTLGFDIGRTASNMFYPFKASYGDESTAFGQSSEAQAVYGLTFGLSADYYFSNWWSVEGDLIYYQKGSGNVFLSRTDASANSYHLNYFTIPIMAGFHFGRTKNWYLNFGAYTGFLAGIDGPSNIAESAKNTFSTSDYGLSGGIGVKFRLNDKLKLFVEYDGQLGLQNILNNNGGDSPSNISLNINAGLNFAIK